MELVRSSSPDTLARVLDVIFIMRPGMKADAAPESTVKLKQIEF